MNHKKSGPLLIAEECGKTLYYDLKKHEIEHAERYAEFPFATDYAYERDEDYFIEGLNFGKEVHGDAGSFKFVEEREGEFVYRSVCGAAEVRVRRTLNGGVLRQSAEIVNLGAKRLCVKKLGNRFTGICADCLKDDYLTRVEIGVVRGEWGGEGQLCWENAETLGLFRATGHKTGCVGEICSPASYTTRKFAPVLFFRDKLTGTVWAAQHLPDGPYSLEIGLTDAENVAGSCYNLNCGAGDSEKQGFRLYLNKGESYRCSETLFTVAEDFGGAVERLTLYRRANLKNHSAPPLMFNDYMNCLWCKLGEEECLSLLDTAQKVGAEGYCFDDGWYRAKEDHGWRHCGDWIPCDARFGSRTFAEMIKEITGRGLVAGLWTELEICTPLSDAANLPKSYFLTNEGERIFRCGRYYFNFSNEHVRKYLKDKIRALYDLGIRYIKNDYNGHPGCGCDWENASPYAGLEQHCRRVHEFYAELKAEFPDLYLENCASGAMRADARTMANFNTQSISDCEEYYKLPSVIGGTLLSLLPEQLSVWVYPYPRIFWEMNGEDYLSPEYVAAQSDGRETAFNVVNGFMGGILLSGKIDRADSFNLELISRGVALFKKWRNFIGKSVPVYPLGNARLTNNKDFVAQGLRAGGKMLLAVWQREGESDNVTVPVKGVASAQVIYPDLGESISLTADGILTVLPCKNSAALIAVNLDR